MPFTAVALCNYLYIGKLASCMLYCLAE